MKSDHRYPRPSCERVEAYEVVCQNYDCIIYNADNNLGARIWDLKAQGVPIKSETVTGKNRYGERTCFARYSIIKED